MSTTSLPRRPRLTDQVAAEVRALMGRHNVTQMQLRDVLGISQTGVSRRLRGLTPFDANEIGLLADFFGVEPSELLGRSIDRGPETPPPAGPDRQHRLADLAASKRARGVSTQRYARAA